jgi:hypothetical protein
MFSSGYIIKAHQAKNSDSRLLTITAFCTITRSLPAQFQDAGAQSFAGEPRLLMLMLQACLQQESHVNNCTTQHLNRIATLLRTPYLDCAPGAVPCNVSQTFVATWGRKGTCCRPSASTFEADWCTPLLHSLPEKWTYETYLLQQPERAEQA